MKVWIFDCNPNGRGENLKNTLTGFNVEAEFHPQVWNETRHTTRSAWSDCSSDFDVRAGDVIFIHAQDAQQFYWKDFVRQNIRHSWIVLYSGGGLSSTDFEAELRNNERICIFHLPLPDDARGVWYLKEFVEAIQGNGPKPFDRLVGHDSRLEAALGLLHACLTPEGAKTARSIQNFNLISDEVESVTVMVDENSKLVRDGQGSGLIEPMKVIDYLSELEAKQIFEDEYIKPLEKLRDELLKDYQ